MIYHSNIEYSARYICNLLGTTLEDMQKRDRSAKYIFNRHILIRILLHAKYGTTKIGMLLRRHHSTCYNSYKVVRNLCFSDPSFKQRYEDAFYEYFKHVSELNFC